MTDACKNALASLAAQGAMDVPGSVAVERAENGMEWSGKTLDGRAWKLTKNKEDSYNVEL